MTWPPRGETKCMSLSGTDVGRKKNEVTKKEASLRQAGDRHCEGEGHRSIHPWFLRNIDTSIIYPSI